jgi:hypothetical protein
VLAATNSFVWNRRFTFRVRGPVQKSEVARFAVVALGTAGLNDLVLLALSGTHEQRCDRSKRAQARSHPWRDGTIVLRHALLGVYRQEAGF